MHHAILVADVEAFSGRLDNYQVDVRDALYTVFVTAFEESGIGWTACVHEDRGDGMFVLVPAEVPKVRLVDQLPHRLVAGLRRYNDTRKPEAQIRLRLALHYGEVRYDDHGVAGRALNLTFRLVDATDLRAALTTSPGLLALIVSDQWYRDVVEQDPAAEASAYRHVGGKVKATAIDGWIRLPDVRGPAPTNAAEPLPLPVPQPVPAKAIPAAPGPARRMPKFSSLGGVVDALARMPCLADVTGRRLCLDLLRRRFGVALEVPEQPVARYHLFAIVLACEQQSNGLAALAEVLADLEPDHEAVARLYQLVGEFTALDLVSERARRELFASFDTQEWTGVLAAYRAAAGPYAPDLPPGEQDADPRELFSRLERLNARPDGIPPALLFVLRLADRATPTTADTLRRWVWEQAETMGLAEQIRTEIPPPPAPAPAGNQDAYLVMRVQRADLDGKEFSVRDWRQLGPGWRPQPGDEVAGTLAEIRSRVAELLAEAESGWAADARLIRLELVLPNELLGLPADQWARGVNGDRPQILGLRYQVVVRSLVRMRTRDWHRDWRRRWQVLRAVTDGVAGDAESGERTVRVRAGDEHELRDLDASLELDDRLVSVLFCPPLTTLTDGGATALDIALRAGIPVMAWCRDPAGAADFEAAAKLAFEAGFEPLRENVRKLRGAAVRADDPQSHVGSHVTLLWDDPDRIVEHTTTPGAPRHSQEATVR